MAEQNDAKVLLDAIVVKRVNMEPSAIVNAPVNAHVLHALATLVQNAVALKDAGVVDVGVRF